MISLSLSAVVTADMGDKGQESGESQVEIWKIKRVRMQADRLDSCLTASGHSKCIMLRPVLQLIKALEEARGNGTSMISLIMPPKDQVAMLT